MSTKLADLQTRDLIHVVCFILSLALLGCSNVQSGGSQGMPTSEVRLLERSEISEEEYDVLGAVTHRCTRWTCTAIDQENCYMKLRRKAEKLGANAVIALTETVEGRGHGGGETFALTCTGNAIRLHSDP